MEKASTRAPTSNSTKTPGLVILSITILMKVNTEQRKKIYIIVGAGVQWRLVSRGPRRVPEITPPSNSTKNISSYHCLKIIFNENSCKTTRQIRWKLTNKSPRIVSPRTPTSSSAKNTKELL